MESIRTEKYIAYYRVSTHKQQRSGLGLEAQRETVRKFSGCADGSCIEAEYIEAESGKNNNRPILAQAIKQSKESGYTLIIAKLDRLARDVQFIFKLRDEKVNFIACDLPDFNTLSLGIFATFAQHERERISQRIKDALAARKARGLAPVINNNITEDARLRSIEVRKANAINDQSVQDVIDIIQLMREKKSTYRAIADKLNARGKKTRNGKEFTATQVMRIEKRFKDQTH